MPHVPLDFREPPKDAVGISRSSLAPVNSAYALGLELPSDVPPRYSKPAAPPMSTGPRKRTLRAMKITERPVSMGKWDVSPHKLANELGI